MNILYVLDSGKPGGMERHVQDLVFGLKKLDHNVYVWCKSGDVVSWFEQAGANVTTKEINFEIDIKYIFELSHFLKQNKIDVIHAHELKASSNALLAGFISGTKVKITHIHTPISEWQVFGTFKNFYTKLAIKGYAFLVNNLSNAEIALTPSRKQIKISEGIKESKLVVLPNGLDTSKFNLSNDLKIEYRTEIFKKYGLSEPLFVLGNVSRISDEKGHFVLLKAYKEFLENENDFSKKFHLLLAGGGPLEEKLKDEVKNLGLSNRVTITGVFSDEDRIKFYSSMNLFIFPTLAEGFGLVMVEAIAMDLILLCSDLEVLKEVSANKLEYFKTGDYVDLANKLHDLCYLIETKPDYSQNAKDFIFENYSLNKFIKGYEDLYKRFLK